MRNSTTQLLLFPRGVVDTKNRPLWLRQETQETTVTLAWIANRLEMGVKTHLSHLLYWRKRNEK